MSREIRRVPFNWEHPTDPVTSRFVPQFAEEETFKHIGYQIYETVTEGTPISPVFTTRVEMVNWLSHFVPRYEAVHYSIHGEFSEPIFLWGERHFWLNDSGPWWGSYTGEKWNGFDCPKFRKEVVEAILADLSEFDGIDYIEIDGVFYVWMEDEDDEWEPLMDYPDEDGLYRLGSYSWVWWAA